ncbi:MAG TPA: YggS family pyridoxal phosphate-dependent enzyme [Candidatus Limnocylindrales bacterium]|nr:YggS family pyridoxal phosphate-dependent enzyme [Candidatus Limnocylindrales bacterium]
MSDQRALADARARILDRIAEACARVARDPAEVTLVAVSKTVPPERLVAAVDAGLTTLGENRVQEAEAKVPAVPGATWHLIGPLQSNKARRALATFDVIESVDSLELARRLDRLAAESGSAPRPILLQVNVDADEAKAGFAPAELERDLPDVLALERLEVRGLMTVGRLVASPEDARPTFVALRELRDRLRADRPRLGPELSMGMSDDYPIAVEEGATIVRVGRALFGARPPA